MGRKGVCGGIIPTSNRNNWEIKQGQGFIKHQDLPEVDNFWIHSRSIRNF